MTSDRQINSIISRPKKRYNYRENQCSNESNEGNEAASDQSTNRFEALLTITNRASRGRKPATCSQVEAKL